MPNRRLRSASRRGMGRLLGGRARSGKCQFQMAILREPNRDETSAVSWTEPVPRPRGRYVYDRSGFSAGTDLVTLGRHSCPGTPSFQADRSPSLEGGRVGGTDPMGDQEAGRSRVLVIEDSKADQAVYRRTLHEFDLEFAESGESGPGPARRGAGSTWSSSTTTCPG